MQRTDFTGSVVISCFVAVVAACGGVDQYPSGAQGGAASVSANGGGTNTSSGGATTSASGGGDTGSLSDPLTASATCSSKVTWSRGENEQMRPGEACIACHASNEGPDFAIAGTVYPTGHEPNDCNGISTAAGVTVVITDAQNVEHRLTPNSAGNFYLEQTIPLPYRAKIVSATAERAMSTQQSLGDCNSCHTQTGANGAPGRIVLPG